MPQKLADDVMAEILLRLPSRAAGRLRWACKYWLSLTTDPYFVRKYYALHPYPPLAGLFLNRTPYGVTFLPLAGGGRNPSVSIPDPPCMRNPPMVLASCNGLILLRCHGTSGFIHFVCNPTDGTIHVVPKPSTPAAEDPHAISYHLAFDGGAGAGAGGSLHEFKVVSIDPSDPPTLFHIYSSATGEWRQSAAAFLGDDLEDDYHEEEDAYFSYSRSGVYFNGSMYWIHGNRHSLHVLHIAEERLTSIPLPQLPDNTFNTFIRDFSASGGGLHVTIEYCREESDDNVSKIKPFNVWEMNPDSSNWRLLYSFTTMFSDDPMYSNKYITPWMFLRNEGEEKHDMLLLHVYNGPFLLYDIADHTYKETETPSKDCEPRSWFSMHIFRHLPF